MKKIVLLSLVALMATTTFQPAMAGKGRGGFMGFISGCCFGLRTSGDYNEGKEVHWREWASLVPIVGLVLAVWTGIEGAQGMTTSDYADKYGSTFY